MKILGGTSRNSDYKNAAIFRNYTMRSSDSKMGLAEGRGAGGGREGVF